MFAKLPTLTAWARITLWEDTAIRFGYTRLKMIRCDSEEFKSEYGIIRKGGVNIVYYYSFFNQLISWYIYYDQSQCEQSWRKKIPTAFRFQGNGFYGRHLVR